MIYLKKSWDVLYPYKDPAIVWGSLILAILGLTFYAGFMLAVPKQTDNRIIDAFAVELHRKCNEAEIKGLKNIRAHDTNCRKLSEWAEKRIKGK